MENKKLNFEFHVISDVEGMQTTPAVGLLLSNVRSECCTRVCTRTRATANEEQWGKFLELKAGVVQY